MDSIREDKRSEKELFDDMLKMMELHDEQMLKVADHMQKQELLVQAQQRELAELKGGLKALREEVKESRRTLLDQGAQTSQKLDLVLQGLAQQREAARQRDEVLAKLAEKVRSSEQGRWSRQGLFPGENWGGPSFQRFGYAGRPDLDRAAFENLRLREELDRLEAEENGNRGFKYPSQGEGEDILSALRQLKRDRQ